MDLMGMFDLGSLGLDATKIAATAELTNLIKELLKDWNLEQRLSRLYVGIPFVAAGIICLINSSLGFGTGLLLDLGKCTVMYGLAATFGWNVYKKTIQGK